MLEYLRPDLILATLGVILIGVWIGRRRSLYRLWSRQGVPGPVPNLIFGNLLDIAHHGAPSKAEYYWLQSYGRPLDSPTSGVGTGPESGPGTATNSTVGFFMGGLPCLFTSELDLIRTVFVKEATVFGDRQRIIADRIPQPDDTFIYSIVFAPPRRWQRARQLLNKVFTTTKLKGNIPIMETSIKRLITDLADRHADTETGLEIHNRISLFTTDVIARCAFGVSDDDLEVRPGKPRHAILDAVDELANVSPFQPFLAFMILFPGSVPVMYPLWDCYATLKSWIVGSDLGSRPSKVIANYVYRVIENRDRHSHDDEKRHTDLLQALMDERSAEEVLKNGGIPTKDQTSGLGSGSGSGSVGLKGPGLTNLEVAANGAVFYGAGYETSSATIAFMVHYLINDQDLQDRIRREVRELEVKHGGQLGYEAVAEMEFLQAVINETLRLHPILTQLIARDALEDYTYRAPTSGREIVIPRGTSVIVDVKGLHRDPAYWDEPDVFRPERFLPDRDGNRPVINPLVYMPFGIGPKYCVGQRFAYLTIKLTIARLLTRFRLIPLPGKSHPRDRLPVEEVFYVQHPAGGVWVRLETVGNN